MEMLLMGACLSLLGLAVTCLAFNCAVHHPDAVPAAEPDTVRAAAPARFFSDSPALPAPAAPRVPIEALLLQIENHVRLEHAAAESFLAAPDRVLLHRRTVSPLVN